VELSLHIFARFLLLIHALIISEGLNEKTNMLDGSQIFKL